MNSAPKHSVQDGRIINFWSSQNAIVDDCHIARMGVTAWAIYSVILRHCNNQTHQAFPSFTYMEKVTGLGRKAVNNAIKKLLQLGYIKKLQKGNSHGIANTYEVVDVAAVPQSNQVEAVSQGNQYPKETSIPTASKVVSQGNSKKTKQKDSSLYQHNGADMLTPAPETLPTPEPPDAKFSLLAKATDLGVHLNNGLKSRILKTPSAVVKVSIADLQAGINKGNVSSEDYARYLNGRITENLKLYQSQFYDFSVAETRQEDTQTATIDPEVIEPETMAVLPQNVVMEIEVETEEFREPATLRVNPSKEVVERMQSEKDKVWVRDETGIYRECEFECMMYKLDGGFMVKAIYTSPFSGHVDSKLYKPEDVAVKC